MVNWILLKSLTKSRGADPRAVDEEGRTPIELAAESNVDDREVVAPLTDSNGWHW